MERILRKVLVLLFVFTANLYAFAENNETQSPQFDWNPVMDAIIQVESEGNPKAVSGNSCGAMQITPILVRECNNILKRRKKQEKI